MTGLGTPDAHSAVDWRPFGCGSALSGIGVAGAQTQGATAAETRRAAWRGRTLVQRVIRLDRLHFREAEQGVTKFAERGGSARSKKTGTVVKDAADVVTKAAPPRPRRPPEMHDLRQRRARLSRRRRQAVQAARLTSGQTVDITSAHECPLQVTLGQREARRAGECKNVTFVSRGDVHSKVSRVNLHSKLLEREAAGRPVTVGTDRRRQVRHDVFHAGRVARAACISPP